MKKPVKISKPNGYNEDYRRECGHEYRIQIEFCASQPEALKKMRSEAANRPCYSCNLDGGN